MDLHGTAWMGFMSNIQSSCETCKKDNDELVLYLGRIQGLLKCKSHLYWHIDYFQKYIEENINPQGIRLHTFSTIKNPTESDSSLSMFSVSQVHNHPPGAQASRPIKPTQHSGGYSPSDTKNKKRPEVPSQSRKLVTSGNLTPALQNILSKGVSNKGANGSNWPSMPLGDFLDPALALLEAKKQGNLSAFALRPGNSQTPQVNQS